MPFSGASPALGSILVDEGGAYVGKVDAVLGTTEAPVVHLAHLDRKRDPESLLGLTLSIRARADRQGGRGGEERRGGRFDRGNDRRRDDREQRGGGDWTCPQCSNSNFSFRTECNRCNAPRGDTPGDGGDQRGRGDRGGGRFDRGNDRGNDRGRGRFDRGNDRRGGSDRNAPKPGDWTCNGCGANNFASRSSCFRCGPDAANREERPQRGSQGGGQRGGFQPRGGPRDGPRGGFQPRGGSRGGFNNRDREDRGPNDRHPGRGGGGGKRIAPKGPFRKAQGKSGGHAHNRAPKPIRKRGQGD